MADGELDWAEGRAARWSEHADRLEAQIAPVNEVLFPAAHLATGERVLDVGCGRGVTTRVAASLVGEPGAVLGLDISTRLLDEARSHEHHGAPIDYLLGDAQSAELDHLEVDAAISRFGVMFFTDPVAAFTNLATAVVPGGRLCVAVWQPRDRSSLMARPLRVARQAAEAVGSPLQLSGDDAGAFSLGDPTTARATLEAAGWSDVASTPHVLPMYSGGPGTPASAAEVALGLGALHSALADVPPERRGAVREAVRTAIEDDLAQFHDGTGVRLEGAIAILTARRY